LDQRLEEGLVDLPQPQHAHSGAKRVEDANVGCAMAVAQPGKIPPSPLLGQQPGQQIERMDRCQQWQQVCAPELGWAELPARTANGPDVAVVVDEVVGNVWIKQGEQLVGAGHGQALHGHRGYPF
jgi:hypothetical protein